MIRPQDSDTGGKPSLNSKKLSEWFEREVIKATKGNVSASQEHYYEAMEAQTEREAFYHLSKAIALDSSNTDAWLMFMNHLPPQNADEEIEVLRKLVVRAEEALGKNAFTEFAGHFWGFHETRPYMRVRAALADALHRAGQIESSMLEVEAMLVLNPGDNQGLRYRQICYCLALSKMSAASAMFARYDDEVDSNMVFAWAWVLERFLSGNISEAAEALTVAQSQNAFASAYLLGHRKIPKHLPDSYALRSREEAMCFAGDLQLAWGTHPAAQKWLVTMLPKK